MGHTWSTGALTSGSPANDTTLGLQDNCRSGSAATVEMCAGVPDVHGPSAVHLPSSSAQGLTLTFSATSNSTHMLILERYTSINSPSNKKRASTVQQHRRHFRAFPRAPPPLAGPSTSCLVVSGSNSSDPERWRLPPWSSKKVEREEQ